MEVNLRRSSSVLECPRMPGSYHCLARLFSLLLIVTYCCQASFKYSMTEYELRSVANGLAKVETVPQLFLQVPRTDIDCTSSIAYGEWEAANKLSMI